MQTEIAMAHSSARTRKQTTPPSVGLMDRPGREAWRRSIEVDGGLSLAWVEMGQGRPVVLLHGMLTTLEDMSRTLGEPLARGYRVVAFDRPGFGRSGARRGQDAGLWNQAAVLGAAIDRLGIDRPIIVGHSFGASLALAMAVRRPESVAAVVALAPLVRPEVRFEHLLFGPRAMPAGDYFSTLGARTGDRALFPLLWRSMFLPQAMPERVAVEFPFSLAARSASAVRAGEDALGSGPDLVRLGLLASFCPVPTVVMGGDRDIVVRNGVNGRRLAALMPNARYVDLPGLGHMIHHFAADMIVAAINTLAIETPFPPSPALFEECGVPS